MLSLVMTCDTLNHTHFILRYLTHHFLENQLSSLFAYKDFHQIFMIIFWPDLCFTRFQDLERFFGVSILEDRGHARNELWDVVYQMSSVICKFSTLSCEYISLKKIMCFYHILYWISDSKSRQRLILSQV